MLLHLTYKKIMIRQQVQFIVYPKYFNVISFYAKGVYSVRIRLWIEDQSNNKIQAFPKIIGTDNSNQDESKKPIVSYQQGQCYFQTLSYFITFSEQKVILNSACIFKVEYDRSKKYKTFLDFQLMHTRTKSKIKDKIMKQKVPLIKRADSRRIYFNNIKDIKSFNRIIFDDSDYFSFVDVCILSTILNEKPRIHQYQLREFSEMSSHEKHKYHQIKQQSELPTRQLKERYIRQCYNESIQSFYQRLILERCVRLKKLIEYCEEFSYLGNVEIQKNLKTMFDGSIYQIGQGNFIEDLFEKFECEDLNSLFYEIFEQSQRINKLIKYVWNKISDVILRIKARDIEVLCFAEHTARKQKKQSSLMNYCQIQRITINNYLQDFLKKREEMLAEIDMYEDHDLLHPFIMVQNHQKDSVRARLTQQIDSLVIFVHGYQGSDIDLEKARNFLLLHSPHSHGLIAKTLQDSMDETIEQLGKLLAEEIYLHISNSVYVYKKINFVGYSLGGVVARQSLRHLQKYKDKMNIFVSLASPHTGITNNYNFLVRTGIWFLCNFEKNKNLKQLNCQPSSEGQEITLLRMSNQPSLSWFKRFIVCSSKEDHFVPHESARLDENHSTELGQILVDNIKKRVKQLQRIQVWFDINHDVGTFDKLTGRRPHIEFLENRIFLDIFFSLYGKHF